MELYVWNSLSHRFSVVVFEESNTQSHFTLYIPVTCSQIQFMWRTHVTSQLIAFLQLVISFSERLATFVAAEVDPPFREGWCPSLFCFLWKVSHQVECEFLMSILVLQNESMNQQVRMYRISSSATWKTVDCPLQHILLECCSFYLWLCHVHIWCFCLLVVGVCLDVNSAGVFLCFCLLCHSISVLLLCPQSCDMALLFGWTLSKQYIFTVIR